MESWPLRNSIRCCQSRQFTLDIEALRELLPASLGGSAVLCLCLDLGDPWRNQLVRLVAEGGVFWVLTAGWGPMAAVGSRRVLDDGRQTRQLLSSAIWPDPKDL